jgi:hypothetical protein
MQVITPLLSGRHGLVDMKIASIQIDESFVGV